MAFLTLRRVERLAQCGVPVTVIPDRGGDAAIRNAAPTGSIELDLPETAAVMASLAAVGPTVSGSAASALTMLAATPTPRTDTIDHRAPRRARARAGPPPRPCNRVFPAARELVISGSNPRSHR